MIKGQLTDTDRTEIVKYRLEKAYRTYNEAIGSIENSYVETAAIGGCNLNCVKACS